MRNPAEIPQSVMRIIESDMARADDMQAKRRHVTRHHGLFHWQWLATTPYQSVCSERAAMAQRLKVIRAQCRENGYPTGEVCALARDPGKFAFCDGGGATPSDFD